MTPADRAFTSPGRLPPSGRRPAATPSCTGTWQPYRCRGWRNIPWPTGGARSTSWHRGTSRTDLRISQRQRPHVLRSNWRQPIPTCFWALRRRWEAPSRGVGESCLRARRTWDL